MHERDVSADPIVQFRSWFDQAVAADVAQPNTIMLATSTLAGRPSVRAVLLKGISEAGLEFFTNYQSRKADELAENPRAAVALVWQELHRQVRVEGVVVRLEADESDAYFATRPRGAQLAALASEQSAVVDNRRQLHRRYEELETEFQDRVVPRPDNWGGYRLIPDLFEFWQGRANRFHDRLQYLSVDKNWEVIRLAP